MRSDHVRTGLEPTLSGRGRGAGQQRRLDAPSPTRLRRSRPDRRKGQHAAGVEVRTMSTLNTRLRRNTRTAKRQRGVAAIEFALVFMLLFIALYGVVTFGAIFYTQQVISRAAEDGARAAMLMPDQENVCHVVSASLASSLLVPTPTCLVKQCSPADASCAVVEVTYLYKDNPILPPVSLLDTSWVPEKLQSTATVARKAS